MSTSVTRHSLTNPPAKACHNCRRSRLRCDRSLPGCVKCQRRGEACLGYGQLLRWTNAVAVRGTLSSKIPQQQYTEEHAIKTGVLSNSPVSSSDESKTEAMDLCTLQFSLVDPLLQDLNPRNRFYISHYAHSVCHDLVSFDQYDRTNPFRSMVMLLGGFNYLKEIVLATSAVHLVSIRRYRGHPHKQELIDALTAKGRAYRLLRQALGNLNAASKPMVMIAVVFFINFDLIDSGRGNWKTHIEAAAKLITSIQNLSTNLPLPVATLADVVVADCITYHILGSAFARPDDTAMSAFDSVDFMATLQRTEAFSYGCSPPLVLNTISKASRLSPTDVEEAASLIDQLRAYDSRSWVYNIQGLSSYDDLDVRISMANSHRLAAVLYIALAVPEALDYVQPPTTTDSILAETIGYLASVPLEHSLAKGAMWPTFMAGAQADDQNTRLWCFGRMQDTWKYAPWACPWGYIESAMSMMQEIWKARDEDMRNNKGGAAGNWLQYIRGTTDRCLIV